MLINLNCFPELCRQGMKSCEWFRIWYWRILIKIISGNSSKLSCKISSVIKNKHIDDQSWAFFFSFNRVKMSPWFYLMWHKFDDIWWSITDQNITQSGECLMCYFTICTLKVFFFILIIWHDLMSLYYWHIYAIIMTPTPSLLRPNSTSFPPIMECIELYVSKLIHLRNKF